MFLQLITLFAILISPLNAECPNIDDLPVMNEAGDNFYCAFNWHDEMPWNHDIPLEACIYDWMKSDYMDGYDEDHPSSSFEEFGGLIVKAGCTLYAYSESGYTGDRIEYNGPATFPDACTGGHCPPDKEGTVLYWGFPSFKCRCQQDPIICQPSDHYVTIMQCDNSNNDFEAKCTYTKTIGTTWTTEASNSMSIDTTIEASMSASFFSFFSADLGISSTTGYDWTQTSSQAKSETEEFKVETVVPPHSILIIEGAEGNCGGNNVKTELFRFTSTDGDGNIISQTLEYFNGNNTKLLF